MSKFKCTLKRISLILLITVTCVSLLVNVILIHDVYSYYKDSTQLIDINQISHVYGFKTGFSHLVGVYQVKAVHRFQYDDHIYSLVFSVDGENQFIADIIYHTEPKDALESTPFYQGKLPKEEFESSSSLPTRNPEGVLNKDTFWIGIYSYEKYCRDNYKSNERNKQYKFYYTFAEDGPKLWTNLKEENIQIINKNLTVSFAE